MKPSSIDLKLISCKDLKAFNFFQKLTVYALVSIVSDDPIRELKEEQKQQQRTLTDRDGDGDGSSPEWNQELKFDLGWVPFHDCGNFFFHFEFRHDGHILGDKLIGECRVPLEDLIQDAGDVARFVSYEVRSADGKPNGIFNFSYRLNGMGTHSSQILEGRITGYPVPNLVPEVQDHHYHAPNQSHVEYPTLGNPYCPISYPPATLAVGPVPEGFLHYPPAAVPPAVSSPSAGDYHHYYPQPPLPPPSPPPTACQYPYPYPYPYPPPPPPPVPHGTHFYQSFGPEAHPWPSGPNFQHRW